MQETTYQALCSGEDRAKETMKLNARAHTRTHCSRNPILLYSVKVLITVRETSKAICHLVRLAHP
jgi:hypothetical protein